MKVLLVITSLGVGGAERLVTSLADRYAAIGHEVMLVRFHGEAELCPGDPRVRLENLDMRRSPMGVLVATLRFRRLVLEFRPDVVNSHLVHANILTRLLRLVTPITRLVSSAHNNNEGSQLRMAAYRLTDSLADVSTNVSESAVEVFRRARAVRPGQMVAIHNGIDARAFAYDADERCRVRQEFGIDNNTPLLLAVGRLWEAKDYPNLLQAFSLLEVAGSSPMLVIAGEGPLHQELFDLAVALGVSDRVTFLGVRQDVPALMSACDVFVLSSAWEGFGLVVAEAMSCQRLVVATDCGGVSEVLGNAGILVPARDSLALSSGLSRALDLSDAERTRIGTLARARVLSHFSFESTAEGYLSLYERM